jgi:murein L,D-transpeptidase YcbB/YkuD
MRGKGLGFITMAIGASALALSATAPSFAQTAAQPSAPAAIGAEVATFYQTWGSQRIWFRDGTESPAVARLVSILQRAAFDGFAAGPQLAAQVQATVAQAHSGNAADIAAAEQTLSSAWVQYVQAIKRPTPHMIYPIPALQPQTPGAEQILLTAAAAPSLEQYLIKTSNLNPIYAQLRDTAWAEAQASGNLTPDPRLLANLDRARSLPASGRFMIVDSATQMLTLYDNGQPVDSMKVIVGTKQLPTPLISSEMYYVVFNPYWNAPDHLVRKTIAPTMLRQGMRYFKSHGYHVMVDWSEKSGIVDPTTIDWKAAEAGTLHIRVRQDPGPLNSMGSLKFPFPNDQDIYLHDTPGKGLFAKDVRDLSNGCVRVEDAKRLAKWLLGHDPVAPGTDPETHVPVPEGVPIVLTYLTAQVKDGKITYLPDIYGWDEPDTTVVANGSEAGTQAR